MSSASAAPFTYCPGTHVRTPVGWGIVKGVVTFDGQQKVDVILDEWTLANAVNPHFHGIATSTNIIQRSVSDVGSCVLTVHGSGVILSYDRTNDMHEVMVTSYAAVAEGKDAISLEGPQDQDVDETLLTTAPVTTILTLQNQDIYRVLNASVGAKVSVSIAASDDSNVTTKFSGNVIQYYSATDQFDVLYFNNVEEKWRMVRRTSIQCVGMGGDVVAGGDGGVAGDVAVTSVHTHTCPTAYYVLKQLQLLHSPGISTSNSLWQYVSNNMKYMSPNTNTNSGSSKREGNDDSNNNTYRSVGGTSVLPEEMMRQLGELHDAKDVEAMCQQVWQQTQRNVQQHTATAMAKLDGDTLSGSMTNTVMQASDIQTADSLHAHKHECVQVLVAGKRRLEMLLDATLGNNTVDKDMKLYEDTKQSIAAYLQESKIQLDGALVTIQEELEAASGVRGADLSLKADTHTHGWLQHLDMVKQLSSQDPVLQKTIANVGYLNDQWKSFLSGAASQLGDTKAVNVIQHDSEDLAKRFQGLLSSAERPVSPVSGGVVPTSPGGSPVPGLDAVRVSGANGDSDDSDDDDTTTPIKPTFFASVSSAVQERIAKGDVVLDSKTWLAKHYHEYHRVGLADGDDQDEKQLEELLTSAIANIWQSDAFMREQVTANHSSWGQQLSGFWTHHKHSMTTLLRVWQQFAEHHDLTYGSQDNLHDNDLPIWEFKFLMLLSSVLDNLIVEYETTAHGVMTGSELLAKFKAPQLALETFTNTVSKQAANLLTTHLESGSMDGDKFKDIQKPLLELVHQLQTGHGCTAAEAMEVIQTSLNANSVETATHDLLSNGDLLLNTLETYKGALESYRGNDRISQLMAQMNSLDVTTALTSTIQTLDVPQVLHTVESLSVDPLARQSLLDHYKDLVLDFLLDFIPTLRIPDVDGMKDDVQYSVSGLDMSGIKIRKENVTVEIGNSLTDEFITFTITGLGAIFEGIYWRYAQLFFPHLKSSGLCDASIHNATLQLGFKIIRVPKGTTHKLTMGDKGIFAAGEEYLLPHYPRLRKQVHTCRVLEGNTTTSGQTQSQSTPTPNTTQTLREMLQSECEWDIDSEVGNEKIQDGIVMEWEPALVLSTKSFEMEKLTLQFNDANSLQWLYQTLANLFAGHIQHYVCDMLVELLSSNSALLLGAVNDGVAGYWPVIQTLIGAQRITSLPAATLGQLLALLGPPPDIGLATLPQREYVCKFSEDGPLGFKLDIVTPSATAVSLDGQKSAAADGLTVRIAGTAAGSQAEQLLDILLPVLPSNSSISTSHRIAGGSIVSVNGRRLREVSEKDVLNSLQGPRPLYIGVRLSDKSYSDIRSEYSSEILRKRKEDKEKEGKAKIVAATQVQQGSISKRWFGGKKQTQFNSSHRKLFVHEVIFIDGPLGLKLKETKSCGGAVIITGFSRMPDGGYLQAELVGCLTTGMIMLAVGSTVVFGRPFEEVMKVLKAAPRPVNMLFVPSPDQLVTFPSNYAVNSDDFVLGKIDDYITIMNNTLVPAVYPMGEQGSSSEDTAMFEPRKMLPGTVILQVNRLPIASQSTTQDVYTLMATPKSDGLVAPLKLAIRDMDSFMHLIRIRDGIETIADDVDYILM